MSLSKLRTIDSYFQVQPKKFDPKEIVKVIINDIFVAATCDQQKHASASDKTYAVWKELFPWIVIDSETEDPSKVKLKCSLCKKFRMKNAFSTTGSGNIQKSTIERHCESVDQQTATKMLLRLESAKETHTLLDQDSEEIKNCKLLDSDIFLIRSVYSLMKNELPIEKLDAILELQRLNSLNMPYRNLSWTTIAEIQNVIAAGLKKKLVDKINHSEYFAILIDESTDITVSKRLSICVRYVLQGIADTSFLGNCELSDGKAHTITLALSNYLMESGVNFSKCVSLATDGASVMMGKKGGVGVQVQAKFAPFVIQTHCIAHRLNLAITDSIKQIEPLKKLKEKFANLYHFISASGNRTFALKQMQELLDEPKLSVKEPYSIRWLGLKNAVEAIYDSYGALLATLSSLSDENSTAKGLYKYFASYKTALLLAFMLDVHTVLGVLCCDLQAKNLIFSDVPPLIDSTVEKIDSMKSEEGDGLVEMRNSIVVKDEKAFYKGDELKYYSEEIESQFSSVKVKYLDNLARNIRKRLRKNDSDTLIYLSQVLEPSTVCHLAADTSKKALQSLGNQFGVEKTVKQVEGDLILGTAETITHVEPLLDRIELEKEWKGVYGMVKGTYRSITLSDLCQRLCVKHSLTYPNMAKLAKIALCMEISSTECERSFSTQNRLKSKLRSSLKEVSLESLLRVSLYGEPVSEYDPVPDTRQWLVKNRRRKRLMQEYKPRESQSKKQKK